MGFANPCQASRGHSISLTVFRHLPVRLQGVRIRHEKHRNDRAEVHSRGNRQEERIHNDFERRISAMSAP